jgi:phage gp46-like protein
MELYINRDGNYELLQNGDFRSCTPAESVLQQARIQLLTHRGSYPFNEYLGSRLFEVAKEKRTDNTLELAEAYAHEALSIFEEIEVESITAMWEKDVLKLELDLRIFEEQVLTAVEVI